MVPLLCIVEFKTKKMKTAICIVLVSLMPALLTAQSNHFVEKKCVLVYSEDEEALVYKDSTLQYHNEILIGSLPGDAGDPIPVYLNPYVKGQYTFKKHPSLQLPEYYTVVIKDKLTGEAFDLKISDSYTFNVNKVTPDRFVLCIDKKRNKVTAMK